MSESHSAGLPNPLPASRAFVVQFGAGVGPDSILSGRIEHIVSGSERRFSSAAELVAVLLEMLNAPQPDSTQ